MCLVIGVFESLFFGCSSLKRIETFFKWHDNSYSRICSGQPVMDNSVVLLLDLMRKLHAITTSRPKQMLRKIENVPFSDPECHFLSSGLKHFLLFWFVFCVRLEMSSIFDIWFLFFVSLNVPRVYVATVYDQFSVFFLLIIIDCEKFK